MKKSILALIAASTLMSSVAIADPSIVTLEFTCPGVTGTGPFVLSNFGGKKIAGYGTETINGDPAFNAPYFSFAIPVGANIPSSLSTYSSSGTGFDPVTGIVTCSYTSSSTFDPFTVSYQMTNAEGCQVATQTASTITINQFIGLA